MSKIHSPVRGLKKNIVRRLLRYVRPYRARVAFILLTSVLYVAFVLLGPVLYGEAIDAMLGAGQVDFSTVYFMTAGFALCVLLAFLSQKIQGETPTPRATSSPASSTTSTSSPTAFCRASRSCLRAS